MRIRIKVKPWSRPFAQNPKVTVAMPSHSLVVGDHVRLNGRKYLVLEIVGSTYVTFRRLRWSELLLSKVKFVLGKIFWGW